MATQERRPIKQVVPGDRILLDLDPAAIQASSCARRQWCPGRYVGRIVYIKRVQQEGPIIKRRTLVSNIIFRVGP